MRRIQWLSALSAILLFSRAFFPFMEHFSWIALVSLIAVSEFIILLTMPRHPVTEFISPRTPERQELSTKIRMLHHAEKRGIGQVRLFINGSGWIEGKILQLSQSHDVLLLKVSGGTENEMHHLKDVVRISTTATDLGPLLEDKKPDFQEPSSHTPKDVH